MASSSTSPDTLVTLKVNIDGNSRRFKLPLRDLGINVLENKLRGLLSISPDAEAVFERYSDSAGSYVVLDQLNTAVYKQLYRAAKAKQKLKLRVTVKEVIAEEEEKTGPKPASVEDEAEEVVTPLIDSSVDAPNDAESPISLREALKESLRSIPLNPVAPEVAAAPVSAAASTIHRSNYAVCCNTCERTIPDVHYHCSTCDDGDFDLCQECVGLGVTCHGNDHWLIKRFVKNGAVINSTTERIAPKSRAAKPPVTGGDATHAPAAAASERIIPIFNDFLYSSIRTCNCCVQELPEVEFVHCTSCEDYDLCRACFAKNRHGHHPKHGFVPAVEGTRLEQDVSRRLAPGRSQPHNAFCDGCDAAIKGIRHKCLDCPDWDYCASCVVNASFIHPGHRFVPIYEPLETSDGTRARAFCRATHPGICCDGPLCATQRSGGTYIVGDRYKCAVCHDTDFCANCEASPANTHNRTHPLIKFKTPVRHVSVTTTGENENGRQMPAMGDRVPPQSAGTSSRSTETTSPSMLATNVLTVVDVKPSEPTAPVEAEKELDEEVPEVPEEEPVVIEEPVAVFVHDTIADGTVFGPDHVFEQTWVLRNEGNVQWPAGCSVKYVGGDWMGHMNPTRPAATEDLESSSESSICYHTILPGETFPFSVLLRTPQRNGRFVSNWRLSTKDGLKFGHRLWCDVVVEPQEVLGHQVEPVQEVETIEDEAKQADPATALEPSRFTFFKLDAESPVSTVHEDATSESSPHEEDYEDCDDEWEQDASDEGFLTDEEYDILDASDEEYLDEQHKRLLKK
ncbi:hypothetical protein B0T26DRAFT_737892 [Lasiosphaeria miniovina]|uniref:ZZ-type domain-containing protein n=1 Tax=Lasiosphaeria miniovina TaxID=1954250 RepID=A0AA40B3Y6_9PEZI|nr:uncharacterized protein B0T26DRAFT_737892 [Lasiosphaeria miniovina]KAK0727082.1 hypothetical protein B0T26DRAFT_737892 [Lasiosphaeria miniovina]